ncbi:heparanase [Bicyclus anynana]|uniref:Heparanase n=1 Tax=Bicyclus anynana TaxID=110368 RepID=A0ABM3M0I0_BICAN|nr:heparanase [Bicyclus anynana]
MLELVFPLISGDTYTVTVGTDEHVNLVDSKFLSFTIDPKYLFSSNEKYNSKECLCMATSLTPAHVRIAGPSTPHMVFRNSSITIEERHYRTGLAVSHSKWEKFVHWAQKTGFHLVFALNNAEKSATGLWDPNSALKVLTVADQANIGQMYWQLGYECRNQTIEEYLNDLETLRVITETFPAGRGGGWRVVGGDVTPCLSHHSKSDFKDYVTLSDDMMDAIFLNGNSSSHELEHMSEKDRYKLLKLLSTSDTPLWLTEHNELSEELERAADWMTSLGYSARNGFSVHYRELKEKELYEPTLSFYMALLFKNLVGERVLNVEIEASQAILFAHCTSLRHKAVSGAVTFYGANMDEEPARFSIKMSKKEQGGDILQFILGHDRNGNIVVNGRAMYYEGDIRPVVKRVRPYKTLLINLPPKSFGFWVLANTQVKACFDVDIKNKDKVHNISEENEDGNLIKDKRSLSRKARDIHDYEENNNKILKEGIDKINKDLKETLGRAYGSNNNRDINHNRHKPNLQRNALKRYERQAFDEENVNKKRLTKYKLRHAFHDGSLKTRLLNKLSKITKDHLPRTFSKTKRSRGSKRNYRVNSIRIPKEDETIPFPKKHHKVVKSEGKETQSKKTELKHANEVEDNLIRNRRSAISKNKVKYEEVESSENEIDVDDRKFGKILHKLKKLSELPVELQEKENIEYDEQESSEGIVLKTKVTDDSAVIDISEKSNSGLLKSTLQEVLSLLAEFNKNINRFWAAMTLLE